MVDWKKASKKLVEKKAEVEQDLDKILVVDDEEQNLNMLKRALSSHYEVITACDGSEALEKLKIPDILTILTDQRMPRMTGIELCKAAERMQHPAARIVLTGFAELGDVIEAINKANIFRFLTKPIDGKHVLETVREAVRHTKMSNENVRLVGMVKELIEENAHFVKQFHEAGIEYQSKAELADSSHAKKVQLSVLFTDIRGFTKFSSEVSASDVLRTLRLIFDHIHEMVYACGGMVDKHLGDGLMAIFGLNDNNVGPGAAAECMKRIVEAYPTIASGDQVSKVGDLRLSVGVASGEVVMGMVGSDRRRELAVLGSPANLSARLQEFTKLALSDEAGRGLLGNFDNAMGVCAPDIATGIAGFREVELPSQYRIRDFDDISKIAVISS